MTDWACRQVDNKWRGSRGAAVEAMIGSVSNRQKGIIGTGIQALHLAAVLLPSRVGGEVDR